MYDTRSKSSLFSVDQKVKRPFKQIRIAVTMQIVKKTVKGENADSRESMCRKADFI